MLTVSLGLVKHVNPQRASLQCNRLKTLPNIAQFLPSAAPSNLVSKSWSPSPGTLFSSLHTEPSNAAAFWKSEVPVFDTSLCNLIFFRQPTFGSRLVSRETPHPTSIPYTYVMTVEMMLSLLCSMLVQTALHRVLAHPETITELAQMLVSILSPRKTAKCAGSLLEHIKA